MSDTTNIAIIVAIIVGSLQGIQTLIDLIIKLINLFRRR